MSAQLLEGKPIAAQIEQELQVAVRDHVAAHQVAPCLAAVLLGEDPASQVYVRNKRRACERVGIASRLYQLDASLSEPALLSLIAQLNADADVHGILVQLPLPPAINATRVLDMIDPLKDVDAFHPQNVGLLVQGRPRYLPCTPHGVLQMLVRHQIPTAGRRVVVMGRSEIVGKPLAIMLGQRTSPWGEAYANATVTLAHTRTRDLAALTREADIVIAAVGHAGALRGDMIRPGATVIDVGINRTSAGLVGDVEATTVAPLAAHLTPVPGGIGPLTIAMLLVNTLTAAQLLSAAQRGD